MPRMDGMDVKTSHTESERQNQYRGNNKKIGILQGFKTRARIS